MFVIKRTDGKMVADMGKSTTGSSYTTSLESAKTYRTREEANADRCEGNEYVCEIGR